MSSVTQYAALAKKHTPKGWTVKYRASLTGKCWQRSKTIATPPPTTLRRLHIYLHECAHAWLHGYDRSTKHRMEFEAETWAFKKMREAGIEPDERSVEQAKAYVRRKIRQALARGAKKIDAEAWEWSESEEYFIDSYPRPEQLVAA